ncbi:hypothetical protein GCM10020001_098100 [Nonomuraea salmonea]
MLPSSLPIIASTQQKASTLPPNAPDDSAAAPEPRPRTSTATAPVEAPEEIPSRYGSASGLRVSACSTAPHTDSPAPHQHGQQHPGQAQLPDDAVVQRRERPHRQPGMERDRPHHGGGRDRQRQEQQPRADHVRRPHRLAKTT